MASTRYVLSYGLANAGGTPTFASPNGSFKRVDTLADVTPPPLVEIGQGDYYFDWDWSVAPAQAIVFKCYLNGIEKDDVISGDPGAPPASTVGVPPASFSTQGYVSAGLIVNRAAVQLGLLAGVAATMSDPFASTNPAISQLIEALCTSGVDLNNRYVWRQQFKEAQITTVGGQATYALPVDFSQMIDQTGWNRTTRLPMLGPESPQEWCYIKAIQIGSVLNVIFRPRGNIIEIGPVLPAGGSLISFDYQSLFWVQTSGSSTGPDQGLVANASDLVCYDQTLMVRLVKLLWLSDRGKDTSRAQEQYDETLEQCMGKNIAGRTLNMGYPRTLNVNPMMNPDISIPLTGWS